MARFEITGPDGGLYEVDAPDEAQAVAAFKKMTGGASTASPGPSSGVAMNATAGLNYGLYGTLGAPVDVMRGAMNLGIRGFNAATGSEVGVIPENSFGGSRFIAETLGGISPELDPANTVAATPEERIARGLGEGVGYAVAPQGLVGAAARAGSLSPRAADTAQRLFGSTASAGAVAGNAAIGGVSGAGAAAGMETASDEWKPVAGLLGGLGAGGLAASAAGIPALGRAARDAAGDYLAPLSQTGRERIAGETLRDRATDQAGLRETLARGESPILEGSNPTTFQATGDMGIGSLERDIATRRPELFNQRRADQNANRLGLLDGMQPGGAPDAVAQAVNARLRQISDASDDLIRQAQEGAQKSAGGLGQGISPEAAGTSLRGSLEAARSQAKAQERELWAAVDPDGSLALAATNARQQAADIGRTMPASAKPPSGEEAAILETLSQYPEGAVPFSEITALSSRVKAEMRAERMANGESPAYRRLTQVNGALQNDLDAAIVGKATQEAEAVAAGRLNVNETMMARFEAKRDGWFAEREAVARGADGGGGPVGFAATGSTTVPGVSGAGGQAGGRFGRPQGDPRLSGDAEPNFDGAARERLNAANAATRQRAETFDNRTLAPLRRRPSTTAPYDVSSAEVAGRIFSSGKTSPGAIAAYRQAVGDAEALPVLQGYAVDRLRSAAMLPDGTLDPAKVTSWRRSHADALRSFPELDRSIADAGAASETLARVTASRRKSLDEAQKGMLGRLAGLEDPGDVTRVVGSIFSTQDSARRMNQLRNVIGDNREAKAGLRKAVADHMASRFIGNTEAGTSGLGTMKADAFQTFIRQNKPALQLAGFNADEIDLMGKIGADLQRANRSIASSKLPGQSNTAQDSVSLLQRVVQAGAANKDAIGGLVLGSQIGGVLGAAVGGVAGSVISGMRQAGLQSVDDILADALLNPGRARLLLAQPSKKTERATAQMLAGLYRQAGASTAAVVANDRQPGPLVIDVPVSMGNAR